jgi:putative transposase
MAKAFVKTVKRDYVERMDRSDDLTVMRQLTAAFEHYNKIHPHSALRMLSPRMFQGAQYSTKCYRVAGEIGATPASE